MKNAWIIGLTAMLLLVVIVFSVVPASARTRVTDFIQRPVQNGVYFGTGAAGLPGCCSGSGLLPGSTSNDETSCH